MSDIVFMPVFSEITTIIKDMKFSAMYFGSHCGRNIFLLKHQTKTVMITFDDTSPRLKVDFHTVVSSRSRSIKTANKIVGSRNVILFLDGEGELWRLINAFEFSNEKDECLHLIDKKCFYEWIPFKKFKHLNVLEIIAQKNNFVCLLKNKIGEKSIQFFSSLTTDVIKSYSLEALNIAFSDSYFLTNGDLLLNNECPEKENFFITDRVNGRTNICFQNGNSVIVNISSIPLVSIQAFPNVKCFFLCFKSGKFMFYHYNDSFDTIKDCSVYLFKQVSCIQVCQCCESCVIWSDGFDLHHTMIQLDFTKNCFVNLLHLQVNHNIMGVKSFCKINNGVLGVTVNDFYYHITVNKSVRANEISMTVDEMLLKIYESGLKMDSLNKQIDTAHTYLKFKEMMQRGKVNEWFELVAEGDCLTLKSNIDELFKKDLWRIKLHALLKKSNIIEMIRLETDLCMGMIFKVKSDLLSMGEVEVSFVGDFGSDFNLLIFNVGRVNMCRNNIQEQLMKNLYEIAKKRNPYFK